MTAYARLRRPRLAAALGLLLALGTGCEDAPPPAASPPPLNAHVLAVVETYPTDGTHGYFWPRQGTWAGNARDLTYDGQVFARGDPEGRCHCSGLTFEVWLQAWQRACASAGRPGRVRDWDAGDLETFRKAWFGTDGDRATLHTALVESGLGRRIVRWEDAEPGDFVQLWRRSGSGHSCIFRRWVREGDRIVGLAYWSTQGSTNGIGEKEERFGDTGSAVKTDELYVVRAFGPGADGGNGER